MARRYRLALAVVALCAASWYAPRIAVACTLDNKPSLAANGIYALRNPIAPTGVGVWAPFIITSPFASGAVVRLTELRASLVRTLSSAALAAPFRWNMGDGAVAYGHDVVHRYARPDLYQVTVYALDTRAHTWFPFDRVLLHIVRPDLLLQFRQMSATPGKQAGLLSMPELAICAALLVVSLARAAMLLNRRRRQSATQHLRN